MVQFSIIMIAYNSAETIEESIQSVLNSSYEDFELIIIDDGSTDQTKNRIEQFQNKKIKYYLLDHVGTGRARNFGVSKIEGNFVLFLDSDDLLSKDALQVLQNTISQGHYDFVVYQWQNFLSKNKMLGQISNADLSINLMGSMIWNKALDSNIAKTIYFPDTSTFEDVGYSVQAYLKSKNPTVLKNVLYYYRQRTDSIVHSKQEPRLRLEIIKGFNQLIKSIDETNISSTNLQGISDLIGKTIIDHSKNMLLEWGYSKKTVNVLNAFEEYRVQMELYFKNHNIKFGKMLNYKYKVWNFLFKHHLNQLACILLFFKKRINKSSM